MKVEKVYNGHGDVIAYNITEIDANDWSENDLIAIITLMESLK